jgi:hypothetical protein
MICVRTSAASVAHSTQACDLSAILTRSVWSPNCVSATPWSPATGDERAVKGVNRGAVDVPVPGVGAALTAADAFEAANAVSPRRGRSTRRHPGLRTGAMRMPGRLHNICQMPCAPKWPCSNDCSGYCPRPPFFAGVLRRRGGRHGWRCRFWLISVAAIGAAVVTARGVAASSLIPWREDFRRCGGHKLPWTTGCPPF